MALTLGWIALEQRVDFIVDNLFSEPVVLIPWVKGSGVYIPGEEGPDPRRTIVEATGIYVTPGARLVGESGRATGGSGGGFNTQLLEGEVWLSITTDKIGDSKLWHQYDRVYMVNRDKMFNIAYVEDSATYRPNIHLIREFDILTGSGNPIGIVAPKGLGGLYLDTDLYQFYRATGPANNLSWNVL